MTWQDDVIGLNSMAPIPYTVTAAGRELCREIEARAQFDACEHHYHPNQRVGLVCCKCGDEAKIGNHGQQVHRWTSERRYSR